MIIRGMLVFGTEEFSETVDDADPRERGAAYEDSNVQGHSSNVRVYANAGGSGGH